MDKEHKMWNSPLLSQPVGVPGSLLFLKNKKVLYASQILLSVDDDEKHCCRVMCTGDTLFLFDGLLYNILQYCKIPVM